LDWITLKVERLALLKSHLRATAYKESLEITGSRSVTCHPTQVNTHSTSGPVTTWMGNCLLTGKSSRYVTNHLGQLSLLSLRGR